MLNMSYGSAEWQPEALARATVADSHPAQNDTTSDEQRATADAARQGEFQWTHSQDKRFRDGAYGGTDSAPPSSSPCFSSDSGLQLHRLRPTAGRQPRPTRVPQTMGEGATRFPAAPALS